MSPKFKLVLGVMDTSTRSENHENDDLWGFWESENEKILVQNEAE